jgi:hypothetical protein
MPELMELSTVVSKPEAEKPKPQIEVTEKAIRKIHQAFQ